MKQVVTVTDILGDSIFVEFDDNSRMVRRELIKDMCHLISIEINAYIRLIPHIDISGRTGDKQFNLQVRHDMRESIEALRRLMNRICHPIEGFTYANANESAEQCAEIARHNYDLFRERHIQQ